MQPETTTIIVLVFLLAGAVKGMIGLGLPTIAMGLLTLAMPPSAAASLLLVPSFITNVWQLWLGPSFGPLLRRLWPLIAGLAIGTLTGGLPALAAGSAGRMRRSASCSSRTAAGGSRPRGCLRRGATSRGCRPWSAT